MWIWDLVEERARLTPDAPCAVDDRGEVVSFGSLAASAERVASALAGRGVGVGDPVCWQLPTWNASVVLTAALSRLGAVQVPLLPILRERELSVVLAQVAPRLVVCPGRWRGVDYRSMWESLGGPDGAPPTLEVDVDRGLPESGDLAALPSPEAARPDGDEHRWIFFTSGTTGVPKGARHTDDSITAGPRCFVDRTALGPADRYPIIFPFTHVGGLGTFFAQLMSGAAAVLHEAFDAELTIPQLAREGVTIGAGGTPIVQLYLAHQRRQSAPLFPDLRFCLAGAAPKPPTLHAAVRREMGGRGCISVYGLTEAPFTTISRLDDPDEALAATEGPPIDGAEVRVVALDGRRCAPGEEGELRLTGPNVMLGYLDPDLDEDAFDDAGWFRTGDLGWVDEAGNVTVSGRTKEIIIRKGENISAVEVEHVLLEHPGVAEVAVVGLPDAATGERCCAVVVPAAGLTVSLDDLGEFARSAGLARQKVPEQLEVVDALPRNAAGKVLKHELTEALAAGESA